MFLVRGQKRVWVKSSLVKYVRTSSRLDRAPQESEVLSQIAGVKAVRLHQTISAWTSVLAPLSRCSLNVLLGIEPNAFPRCDRKGPAAPSITMRTGCMACPNRDP